MKTKSGIQNISPIIQRTQFSTLFQAISHIAIKLSAVIKDSIKTNFQSKLKIPICGDEIQINLIINEDKVVDFGYEGKSCIYCQASASLLSKISINTQISKILRSPKYLKLTGMHYRLWS